MYGLPEDTDLSALVGCRLESVSVGLHQVNLGLDGLRNIAVTIEGDFSVAQQGHDEVRYSSAPEGAVVLISLLDAEIVAASASEGGTTVIRFSHGATAAIYDSEAHYESYQIQIGERLIVV